MKPKTPKLTLDKEDLLENDPDSLYAAMKEEEE